MALVERLMGLADDGVSPAPETPDKGKITVHAFFAAQSEIVRGALTVAQVKSALNMDAACAAEYDLLVALAPTGGTTAAQLGRLNYINMVHSIFILAEGRYTQYATPAQVRTKLGI